MGTALAAGLKGLRQETWERFLSLPWPSKTDEEWRRTDPALFKISEPNPQAAAPGIRVEYEPIAPELIRSGVILTDLQTALRQFPELVERYLLETGQPEGLRKFAFLHRALWNQGVFLYVPEGVKVSLPLKTWIETAPGAKQIYPHVLAVLESGAEAALIDERRGTGSASTISNEMVEIILKEGASLKYLHVQRWNNTTSEIFIQRAVLEKEARFLNITVGIGGAATKAHVETVLQGAGAHSDLLGILVGGGTQHFDFHTVQDHKAERTFSDLLYKSALKDTAKMIYTGLIRIEKSAQKSDAYQANRNLLLSDGASADSMPMLEILADDVRCTHGVAVGPVDEEQLFYLMSRGLSPLEAERLIVEGFFEQVLQKVPLDGIHEQLLSELTDRLVTS